MPFYILLGVFKTHFRPIRVHLIPPILGWGGVGVGVGVIRPYATLKNMS